MYSILINEYFRTQRCCTIFRSQNIHHFFMFQFYIHRPALPFLYFSYQQPYYWSVYISQHNNQLMSIRFPVMFLWLVVTAPQQPDNGFYPPSNIWVSILFLFYNSLILFSGSLCSSSLVEILYSESCFITAYAS